MLHSFGNQHRKSIRSEHLGVPTTARALKYCLTHEARDYPPREPLAKLTLY